MLDEPRKYNEISQQHGEDDETTQDTDSPSIVSGEEQDTDNEISHQLGEDDETTQEDHDTDSPSIVSGEEQDTDKNDQSQQHDEREDNDIDIQNQVGEEEQDRGTERSWTEVKVNILKEIFSEDVRYKNTIKSKKIKKAQEMGIKRRKPAIRTFLNNIKLGKRKIPWDN